jgi:protein CpxP
MKKIILLFVAMIAFTATNAQEKSKSQKADAVGRATTLTEKMSTALALTADQKSKVQNINLERMKLMDLNQEKSGNNPNIFEQEKQRIISRWESDLSSVLSPEQMTSLKKQQAQEKAKNSK